MEVVDIVDDQGTVLFSERKDKAHKKGLLHPTIIAEVINDRGEWVLVAQASDKQDAGQYVSPVGGHIRSGETETDALAREALEELGIKNFSYKRIGQAVYKRSVLGRIENHLFIVYEIYSNSEPVLNYESASFRRFTKAEIRQLLKTSQDLFGAAFHFIAKEFYAEFFH